MENTNNNLEIVLELMESKEKIEEAIKKDDRQLASAHYDGLEKRLFTLRRVYPHTHILSKIATKIYASIASFYIELEEDIAKLREYGIVVVPNEEVQQ